MNGQSVARVLIAEDDGPMRDLLAASLRAEGFVVELVADGHALRERLGAGGGEALGELPQVVVSDVRMPGWTGLHALSFLSENHPSVHVVLITAFGDPRTHARARRLGASAVFDKPFDLTHLRQTLLSLVAT